MDIAASLAALIVSGPIILLAMACIKLDSPGPVFFVQKRVGLNGRTFRMLKLRSMQANADTKIHQEYLQQLIKDGAAASEVDADGKPVYKLVNDPRITRVGKFIRKTSIDELPQLINVLRGEMSLVGPRPPLQYEVDEYEDWHHKRLTIRPGITGLWQVSGRSQLTYEQMIQLDIQYIENWSLWSDIKILFKTIPVVLKIGQSY
jgi:exopolysaccharide biosynthesis polyprenyl glycosylphosphotransferase